MSEPPPLRPGPADRDKEYYRRLFLLIIALLTLVSIAVVIQLWIGLAVLDRQLPATTLIVATSTALPTVEMITPSPAPSQAPVETPESHELDAAPIPVSPTLDAVILTDTVASTPPPNQFPDEPLSLDDLDTIFPLAIGQGDNPLMVGLTICQAQNADPSDDCYGSPVNISVQLGHLEFAQLEVVRALTPDYVDDEHVPPDQLLQGWLPNEPYFLFVGQVITVTQSTFYLRLPNQWGVWVTAPPDMLTPQVSNILQTLRGSALWLVARSVELQRALEQCRNSLPSQNLRYSMPAAWPQDGCVAQKNWLNGVPPPRAELMAMARIVPTDQGHALAALWAMPLDNMWIFADLSPDGLALAYPQNAESSGQIPPSGLALAYGKWDSVNLKFNPTLILQPYLAGGADGNSYYVYGYAWGRK